MSRTERRDVRLPAAQGLLGDARVRLLDRLCGSPQTAAELASRLGISANAVRVHLEALRAAGLVAYRVERRGVGKPRHVYSITTAAEYLLSTAYAPTLIALLKAADDRSHDDVGSLLRAAGETLFREMPARPELPPVTAAARALESLGRPVRVTKEGSSRVLATQCCPLGAVSRESPHICALVEAMLISASGLAVRETCHRGDQPRCRFRVEPSRAVTNRVG